MRPESWILAWSTLTWRLEICDHFGFGLKYASRLLSCKIEYYPSPISMKSSSCTLVGINLVIEPWHRNLVDYSLRVCGSTIINPSRVSCNHPGLCKLRHWISHVCECHRVWSSDPITILLDFNWNVPGNFRSQSYTSARDGCCKYVSYGDISSEMITVTEVF